MSLASPLLSAHSDGDSSLPESCQESFARLVKLTMVRRGKFQFLTLDCRDQLLRERLIAGLDDSLAGDGRPTARLSLTREAFPNFADVERALTSLAQTADVVHVTGGSAWFDTDRWESFNIRREAVARDVGASLLFWLDPSSIATLARVAVDLWAWRTAVIAFATNSRPIDPPAPDIREFDGRDSGERFARIAFLREVIDEPDLPAEIAAGLALEMGDLLFRLGELPEAETAFRKAVVLASTEGLRAVARGRIANVLQARGDLDEALRIRREEELPVYERIGDVRSIAITHGNIADMLQTRGDLDEALRIRLEEQLPVYDRLGDVRSFALTQGKIADVLEARGELDEALRIRREELLPVYERLGDIRSFALTQGEIADVLQARGELDEVLRIRREEELPVYNRLGDVRSRAMTWGRIADVLQLRGELEEALRIRREELLPVYERLGDVRSFAVTQGGIADVLQAQGNLNEALRIRREEELPVYDHLGDVNARARTWGRIADVVQAQGNLAEALLIRREEELPVYDALGNVHARAATLLNVAAGLVEAGGLRDATTRDQIIEALSEAFTTAKRIDLAEGVAKTGDLWGQVLGALGREEEALKVLEKARAAFAKIGDREGATRVKRFGKAIKKGRYRAHKHLLK